MNDLIWIGPALVFGLVSVRFGLPPMVGYLIGGFALNIFGDIDRELLSQVGEIGVTLLLFTIGLKLDVRSLLKPVVWVGATLHMLIIVVLFGIALFWLSFTGLALFSALEFEIALLIAFALSFSSTVFAVKVLEEHGEFNSKHGQIAIGILIMQDIFAVLFLALSTGKIPSVWALGLAALIPLRPLLMHVMSRVGHGELLILYGLSLSFGVWALFEFVGVKGDLGALVIGALLASHPSAAEMSKKLLGFKDLLLVGFFLSIGMSGSITVPALIVAFFLAVAVVVKVGLYFLVFVRFRLRARTAVFSSLNLANYSEFGLIVGAIALSNGWLSGDWLVIIALALTMTFIIAAPLNKHSRRIYSELERFCSRFESPTPLAEDAPINPGNARIVIIGMERLGTGAYDTLAAKYGGSILGIDAEPNVVERHKAAGRNVILADVTDDDFWSRAQAGNVQVALLALHGFEENLGVAQRIQQLVGKSVYQFAVADYSDQMRILKQAGVDGVWNIETEAGTGFAEDVMLQLEGKLAQG